MFETLLFQMLDSEVEVTRIFWRQKYLGFTEAQARDPRPWAEVAKEWLEVNGQAIELQA